MTDQAIFVLKLVSISDVVLVTLALTDLLYPSRLHHNHDVTNRFRHEVSVSVHHLQKQGDDDDGWLPFLSHAEQVVLDVQENSSSAFSQRDIFQRYRH